MERGHTLDNPLELEHSPRAVLKHERVARLVVEVVGVDSGALGWRGFGSTVSVSSFSSCEQTISSSPS